jgi:uncharacterized protein YacL
LFVEIVRLFMVVLFTAAGFWVGRDVAPHSTSVEGLGGMLGCLLGYVGGGMLGRLLDRAVGVVERQVDRLPAAAVLAGLVGGVAGGVAGATLGVPVVVLLPARIGLPLAGLLVWLVAYFGFRVAARQSDQLFHAMGLSTRPLVRATPFDNADGVLVDTSAVMDGQLLALSRSGVFHDDLLVPRFVLDELQGMADAPDETRARRARRGLEMLDVLRREAPLHVYVLDDEVPELADVDAKLASLARRLKLRLLTNDANLARVAEVQGVPTINLRRLASDLAPAIMAGQGLRVELTRPGRQPGQGVGFLDDGSMVVVNGGADLVGSGELDLVATSIVPTAAGRIVFARPAAEAHPDSAGADNGAAPEDAVAPEGAGRPQR